MSEIVSNLKKVSKLVNLVDEADLSSDNETHDQTVERIGFKVLSGFKKDKESMQEWLDDVKKVEELASLAAKKKNRPLPNSANIKYPLITKAGYEFSSRTYPEIIKDGKVVKGRVIGLDLDGVNQKKAERTSTYMNYQLLFEQEDWEADLDTLLTRLSLIGFLCRKTYFDPVRKIIKSEICKPCDLIVSSDIKSLEDARRISHIIHVYLNDLIENVQAGIYNKEVVDELIKEMATEEHDPKITLIEQHTFIDLDDDSYSEPYIVTILEKSGKVLRIAPRFDADSIISEGSKLKYIDPIRIFTDYHFLVNPKGLFQSVGFGILMLHLNETINSILNMLIDAGQLSNLQGGYKDARLKNMGSGDTLHDPGEWKTVKAMAGVTLKDGIVPHAYKEPSAVLLKLLGLLIQTGKELSSSTEVMTGASNADNAKTGAVNALQQAGLKVFTAIQRRIYRSLTLELRKIFRLNSIYADPEKYFTILNEQKVVMKEDFDIKNVHILPVADPNLSSDMQRAERNQILVALLQLPGTNQQEIVKEIIQNSNLNVPAQQLMADPSQQKPDPNMVKIQAEIQSWAEDKKLKAEELHIRQFEAKTEYFKVEAQILQLKAQAMLAVAQAQAQQDNGKFKEYELQLAALSEHLDAMRDAASFMADAQKHKDTMAIAQQKVDNDSESIANDKQANQQAANQGISG